MDTTYCVSGRKDQKEESPTKIFQNSVKMVKIIYKIFQSKKLTVCLL